MIGIRQRFFGQVLTMMVGLIYLLGVVEDFSFLLDLKHADAVVSSCADHECGCGPDPGQACCCSDMAEEADEEAGHENPSFVACGAGNKPPAVMRIVMDPHLPAFFWEPLVNLYPVPSLLQRTFRQPWTFPAPPEKIPIFLPF